jgi:hypothetical protein
MDMSNIITHLIGNEYCCRTANGDNFSLIFESLAICKDNNENSASISLEAGAIILKWISGSFKKSTVRTATGHTRIHGTCDGVVNFIGIQKNILFNIGDNCDIKKSDFINSFPQISIVVSAYNLDHKINDFIQWNSTVFNKTKNLEIVIIVSSTSNFQVNNPIVKIIKYPKKQDIFSIGRTINFGIRNTKNTPKRIIIKTDIDIVFTNQILNFVLHNVSEKVGVVALPAYIDRSFNLNCLEDPSYWNRKRKTTDARGACFALTREDWFNLNGYDERIEGWGGDDTEMWFRTNKKLKHMKVTIHYPIYHISHDIRIGTGNFIHNSDKNIKVSEKLDWRNEKWGLVYD